MENLGYLSKLLVTAYFQLFSQITERRISWTLLDLSREDLDLEGQMSFYIHSIILPKYFRYC